MTDTDDLEDTLSALYHSLRAARRRYVIQFLQEDNEDELTTRELARKITSLEQECPERQSTGEPYRNAYNALSQTHLPELSEAGIIIYDSQRQIVSTGRNFELTVLLLEIDAATVDVFQTMIDSHGSENEN
ncbi:DUF7344 domain-containing protein [Halorientalis salina]|uniref:DUF7344 domain-containing protein n=1 Tax=Halorientalis salina TaxID=2932266 RepID=UPI0010AC9662|nr:hypothetical protein [Halorientalis salina]